MKCYSFEMRDLERHFDRMSRRFYTIDGMDDVNIKRTFLNSLSEPLGDETLRMMNIQRITLNQASLGEIYQHMLIALEKLCNQRKFLSKMEKIHNKLKDSCKRKDLQIKFHEKGCNGSIKKRTHFRKYSFKKKHYAEPKKMFFKKNKWRFLIKKKKKKQFRRKTSKVCFVCRKPGHFAKTCLKREKATKLLEQAQIHAEDTHFSDVESLYSLDDEYSSQALVVMGYSTIEEDSDSKSVASDPEIQDIYTSQPTLVSLASPIPIAQVHILLDSYFRPTPVIALFDTSVAATIIHPKILPEEFWLPHYQMFRAANGETFPITINKLKKKKKKANPYSLEFS